MSLPIPIDQWIEHPLGIDFEIRDLSAIGPDILGFASVEHQAITVGETLLANAGRFRFTCAHELGHLFLHAEQARAFQESGETVLASRSKTIEREADAFAAAFLMPRPMLEESLRAMAAEAGLTSVFQLGDASCFSPWDDVILPTLSEQFEVSRQAAAIRCGSLRWSGSRPLMHREVKDRLLQKRGSGQAASTGPGLF